MTVSVGGYMSSTGGFGPDDTDADVIANMLQATLDGIVATFERADVALPLRRYIHFGATVADCEQLTVQLDQLYFGTPGGDPSQLQRCDGPRVCAFTAQLWRKAPSMQQGAKPPPATSLTAAALESGRDAWLLLNSVATINVEAGWGTGVISEVTALEHQGGYKGLNLSLVVPVP